MDKIDCCPMCRSKHLEVLKELQFSYPGDEVRENLSDLRYVRLWILFEKILENRNPVEFHSILCSSCGFIFTNPRFTAEEISAKYATIESLGSVKERWLKHPPSKLDLRANRILSLITSVHQPNSKMKVLDYGGASGYNLAPFVEGGHSGYILDYEKWDLPSGIEYSGRGLRDLKPDDLFDVILCLHTLEHAVDPMDMLRGLLAHLSGSGILYVEVPLGCFREYRNMNEPLTHVNFFSEESAYKAFQSIGLNVTHLSTVHQWVTHENLWCVNIIGSKDKKHAVTEYRSTRQQMKSIQYYRPLFIGKIRRFFGK